MISYKYTARDPASGKKIEGELQSDSEQSVTKTLKEQGYAVLTIKAEEQSSLFGFFNKKVKAFEVVLSLVALGGMLIILNVEYDYLTGIILHLHLKVILTAANKEIFGKFPPKCCQ